MQKRSKTRKQRRGGSSALFLTGAVAVGVLAASVLGSGIFKPKKTPHTPLRHSPPRHSQHKVTRRTQGITI